MSLLSIKNSFYYYFSFIKCPRPQIPQKPISDLAISRFLNKMRPGSVGETVGSPILLEISSFLTVEEALRTLPFVCRAFKRVMPAIHSELEDRELKKYCRNVRKKVEDQEVYTARKEELRVLVSEFQDYEKNEAEITLVSVGPGGNALHQIPNYFSDICKQTLSVKKTLFLIDPYFKTQRNFFSAEKGKVLRLTAKNNLKVIVLPFCTPVESRKDQLAIKASLVDRLRRGGIIFLSDHTSLAGNHAQDFYLYYNEIVREFPGWSHNIVFINQTNDENSARVFYASVPIIRTLFMAKMEQKESYIKRALMNGEEVACESLNLSPAQIRRVKKMHATLQFTPWKSLKNIQVNVTAQGLRLGWSG